MKKAEELLNITNAVNNSVDISRAMEFIYDRCKSRANEGYAVAHINFNEINQYFDTYGNVHDRVIDELIDQGFKVKVVSPTWSETYLKLSWSKVQ